MLFINFLGIVGVENTPKGLIFHYLLVIPFGVALYLLIKSTLQWIKTVAILSAAVGLFCLFVSLLPMGSFGNLPVVAWSTSFFIPLCFLLFFRGAPTGREAFLFAITMTSCEMLWSLIFPILTMITPKAPSMITEHLFSIYCWMAGCAGLSLAIVIKGQDKPIDIPPIQPNPQRWRLFGFIFAAILGVNILMGLLLGLFIPKTTLEAEPLSVVHFLLLFVILFGGRLWDLRPDKAVIVCSGMLIAALGLSVAYNQGLMGQGLAYSLLERSRVLLLIGAYAAAAKLFKREATLVLLIAAVYVLMPIQSIGLLLRGVAIHIPFGVEIFSVLITAGIVACLWRFRRIIVNKGGQDGFF